jgi:phosphate transport system ATP-binding protein
MKERSGRENRGAIVMDESERIPETLSDAGDLPGSKVDAVLEESAKLADITRERRRQAKKDADAETVFELRDMSVTYSGSYAVRGVNMTIRKNEITALIGPSGCGKTTVLRCLNRTNDLIQGARVEGSVLYHGIDLYGPKVEPVEVRRRIGMVFQKPNPFPKSIYDNIAFGPRVGGFKGDMDELVERSLRRAALWDEVKRDLKASAMALSGGQQQRLCIARCIAVEPDVILMDEPCSALDPVSTLRIEELMDELVSEYTIVIVTHNMQQAARVSDRTGFFTVAEGQDEKDHRIGILVEFDSTTTVFTNPSDSRTEAYVTGRFG